MDYEIAARNAVIAVFDCEWKGCFFHFTQCVWRKVQTQGLQLEYKENAAIRTYIRRIAALPLIPVERVGSLSLLCVSVSGFHINVSNCL
jgi:hypothetical protein